MRGRVIQVSLVAHAAGVCNRPHVITAAIAARSTTVGGVLIPITVLAAARTVSRKALTRTAYVVENGLLVGAANQCLIVTLLGFVAWGQPTFALAMYIPGVNP